MNMPSRSAMSDLNSSGPSEDSESLSIPNSTCGLIALTPTARSAGRSREDALPSIELIGISGLTLGGPTSQPVGECIRGLAFPA
ncbi:hypothetical protein BJH93_10550 [Kocuria polaris]|nr:hypothetical protein [Kocuria polaris]